MKKKIKKIWIKIFLDLNMDKIGVDCITGKGHSQILLRKTYDQNYIEMLRADL
jgi:hypothetical protein